MLYPRTIATSNFFPSPLPSDAMLLLSLAVVSLGEKVRGHSTLWRDPRGTVVKQVFYPPSLRLRLRPEGEEDALRRLPAGSAYDAREAEGREGRVRFTERRRPPPRPPPRSP